MSFLPCPTAYIIITMLKVILKTKSIEQNYTGGWRAFAEKYELDIEGDNRPSLVPLTSMNYDDLDATVDELIEMD